MGFYSTTDDENHLCRVSLREMSPSQGTSLHTVNLTLLSCGLEPCKSGLALTLSSFTPFPMLAGIPRVQGHAEHQERRHNLIIGYFLRDLS